MVRRLSRGARLLILPFATHSRAARVVVSAGRSPKRPMTPQASIGRDERLRKLSPRGQTRMSGFQVPSLSR